MAPARTAAVAFALLALAVLWPTRGRAQVDFPPNADQFELLDVLELVVLPHELLAIDARGGGQTAIDLELGENVLWHRTRGRVGLVVTDRRILAVSTISAAWQDTRLRRTEKPPAGAELGGRVALVTTRTRAIGFSGTTGNIIVSGLGPREVVQRMAVGENVGVILTDRRALGLSAAVGGFFETPLRLAEDVESVSALANLVTITTAERILIFRGPSGSWEERTLDLAR